MKPHRFSFRFSFSLFLFHSERATKEKLCIELLHSHSFIFLRLIGNNSPTLNKWKSFYLYIALDTEPLAPWRHSENSRPVRCCYRVGKESRNASMTPTLARKQPGRLYTPVSNNNENRGMTEQEHISFLLLRSHDVIENWLKKFSHENFIAMNLNGEAGEEQLFYSLNSFVLRQPLRGFLPAPSYFKLP